jgi:hypothetical protein
MITKQADSTFHYVGTERNEKASNKSWFWGANRYNKVKGSLVINTIY